MMKSTALAISRDKHVRQFTKFVLVGVLSTIISFILYVLFLRLGLHYLTASAIAFGIATLNGYTWNRIWTYRAGGYRHHQLAKFAIIQAVGLAVNLSVLYLAVEFIHLHKLLAWLIANGCAVPAAFIGNKFWTFRT